MADWQVGDLAVCVYPGRYGEQWVPQKGAVYTVAGVDVAWDDDVLLDLEEDPDKFLGDRAWEAADFRKVVKDKHEACEEEFVTLLKRAKRSVTA